MIGIGLMSGTSLDGVDAALVEITETPQLHVRLLNFTCLAYSEEMKNRIKAVCSKQKIDIQQISQLNKDLGDYFLQACQQILAATPQIKTIDFIASHGQTLWHETQNPTNAHTLQMGEVAQMAYTLNTTVVSDFRVMDVAAGGLGAPLIPFSEQLLFQKEDKVRLLQNIGGIGNVTYLPMKGSEQSIFGFDTGPGNMLIDEAMRHFYQLDFDNQGIHAKEGKLADDLFEFLCRHPYLSKNIPKSTGREAFGKPYFDKLLAIFPQVSANDFIYTLTKYTAYTIALHYQQEIFPLVDDKQCIEIILAGGGAYNLTLVNELQHYFPDIPIYTQEDLGFSSEAKEAIGFALMGYYTLQRRANNIPAVTGAKNPVILGKITPKPRQ